MLELSPVAYPKCTSVGEALDVLTDIVERQSGGDLAYFRGQYDRYSYTIQRIASIFPADRSILDIGSHYLHQAGLLSLLGYKVSGIDLPLFAEAAFVKERANILGVSNSSVSNLERGAFLHSCDGMFDIILFTETIEHITFNPIAYWRRVYELLSERGAIYVTTPNALRPSAMWSALIRLVGLRGIGISVPDILNNVTYGHHWKEYSPAELRQYFVALSSDFKVEIEMHSFLPANRLKRAALQVLGLIPVFRSDIEAVIRLAQKNAFTAASPELAMCQTERRG